MSTIIKSAQTVIFLVMISLIMTQPCQAQQYPKPTGYVNDFANLFTREQGASLNDELTAFEKKTTIEIAVVTVPWLNNQSIEDYTRGLAKEWGVGKRGQNNGVVFLIAPKERKMRIETASGAHAILNDDRADQIRDNEILPRFRSGNMAQGIIDGTHTIMRTFDANTAPTASEGSTQAPQSQERRAEDTKILGYVLGSIGGVVLLLFLIVPLVRRSRARKYVLENRAIIITQFGEAEKTTKHPDVKEEIRKKLTKLKDEFSTIERLSMTSQNVKWLETRDKLDSMAYTLSSIVSEMEREIAFANKARVEGPKLMKEIPGMIEAAEKKLAEGKKSPQAAQYLKNARTQYTQAQAKASGMTMVDWVIIYAILSNIESNVASAESAHSSTNDSWSPSSNSSDSRSSISPGFGDSGGFGGGGGFGSGGGGSSGSW